MYWVLGLSYIVLSHWVLGPYAIDVTSRATTHLPLPLVLWGRHLSLA